MKLYELKYETIKDDKEYTCIIENDNYNLFLLTFSSVNLSSSDYITDFKRYPSITLCNYNHTTATMETIRVTYSSGKITYKLNTVSDYQKKYGSIFMIYGVK